MKKRQTFLLSIFINRERTFLTAGKKILSNKKYWSPMYIFLYARGKQNDNINIQNGDKWTISKCCQITKFNYSLFFLSFKDNIIMKLCFPNPTFIRTPWGKKADNGCYREDPSIPYLIYLPLINVHCQIIELLTKLPF